MFRYVLIAIIPVLVATACGSEDKECVETYYETEKKHALEIDIIAPTGNNDRPDHWTVTWADLENPTNSGIMVSSFSRMPDTFEGPINKVTKLRITVSSPGFYDESFDFEFEKGECLYKRDIEEVRMTKVDS
ncbi:MAG: hypothetical protein LBM75_01720 [Myxococcales bacterium]|nr:hypothetical protein [Myxococcales bacterium]